MADTGKIAVPMEKKLDRFVGHQKKYFIVRRRALFLGRGMAAVALSRIVLQLKIVRRTAPIVPTNTVLAFSKSYG
jgi:hypothetical protein